jgi:hypothetical protein
MNIDTLISWINEVPSVDAEDIRAGWNLDLDMQRRSAIHGTNNIKVLYALSSDQEILEFFQSALTPGADLDAVHSRMMLLRYAFEELALPELKDGKPSDAIVRAVAKVSMKATPNDGLPCDLNELLQLIETEKGLAAPAVRGL